MSCGQNSQENYEQNEESNQTMERLVDYNPVV